MRLRVLILIGAVVLSGALFADETDEATERAFAAETTNALASPTINTGSGSTPTNQDFLSLFIAALESYSDSGGEAITFDYNLPDAVFGKVLSSKAKVVLHKPALSELIAKKYADKAGVVKALESGLNYGDDVTFTFGISPQAKQGAENVREAFRAAAPNLFTSRTVQIRQERLAARAEAAREIARQRASAKGATDNAPAESSGFAALNAALRREPAPGRQRDQAPSDNVLLDRNTGLIDSAFEEISIKEQAAKTLIEDMAALAANQSKFTLNASYRDRNSLVGADEWAAKVAYEWAPGTNVGKRMSESAANCEKSYASAKAISADGCTSTFSDALRETVADPMVDLGTRFTFALEYKDKSGVDVNQIVDLDPADETVTFKGDGARSVIGSVASGWDVFIINSQNERERSGRVEIALSYDDVSDDKDRNDRFIGKLTYIQRITEKLTLPVSITYANHAEYLGEVDHKLNAHFGISYKLPDL